MILCQLLDFCLYNVLLIQYLSSLVLQAPHNIVAHATPKVYRRTLSLPAHKELSMLNVPPVHGVHLNVIYINHIRHWQVYQISKVISPHAAIKSSLPLFVGQVKDSLVVPHCTNKPLARNKTNTMTVSLASFDLQPLVRRSAYFQHARIWLTDTSCISDIKKCAVWNALFKKSVQTFWNVTMINLCFPK